MSIGKPLVPNIEKVQEYKNLESRLDKMEKWIFVDFRLISPRKLTKDDYKVENPPFFDLGMVDQQKSFHAYLDNATISIQHKILQIQASLSNNVSKIFVVLDEFVKNPDMYLRLAEFIAENDRIVVMAWLGMEKYTLINTIRSWFDKEFKKALNSEESYMLISKQMYDNIEGFHSLIEYLAEHKVNLQFSDTYRDHIPEEAQEKILATLRVA